MSCITVSAAVRSGKHVQSITEIQPVPLDYMGDGPGLGAVNLTLRQLPPAKPNAVLEQGVGRSQVTGWERQDHIIHDNSAWSLGVGALFQPADLTGGGGGPSVQTPIPISTQLALEYIQNRERQSVPGSFSQRTVPAGRAQTNTAKAVLR
jgi:hypothetical protein